MNKMLFLIIIISAYEFYLAFPQFYVSDFFNHSDLILTDSTLTEQ